MKSEMFPACTVCNAEIASDANVKNYCRLCGMGMTDMGRRWCNGCEEKFNNMVHYENKKA